PAEMLAVSPKGTVPVLVLPDGSVIDESLDIMDWALSRHDSDGWRFENDIAKALIQENDGGFKRTLDRYKYADRYPEQSAEDYRQQGELFLAKLEDVLSRHAYLLADHLTQADVAIFPFIRQFAMVDMEWFESAPYPKLRLWLERLLASDLFTGVMQKHPVRQPETSPGL